MYEWQRQIQNMIEQIDLYLKKNDNESLSLSSLSKQSAYSEYYFTDICWPDFNKEELRKALAAYQSRSRRFGGV